LTIWEQLRYTAQIAAPITIAIYGPVGLYLPARDFVIPRLETPVSEPLERPEGEPPVTTEPASPPLEPSVLPPWKRPIRCPNPDVVSWDRPHRFPSPDVLYFKDINVTNFAPVVVEAKRGDFEQIHHEGLIVVIESARSLTAYTLESLQERAEEIGIETLPVYVRRLD
jgi:hypothetical protein